MLQSTWGVEFQMIFSLIFAIVHFMIFFFLQGYIKLGEFLKWKGNTFESEDRRLVFCDTRPALYPKSRAEIPSLCVGGSTDTVSI